MTAMVVVDRLVKTFGNFVAVDGISLTVAKGEVLGFLGPNGAGKTTTMRMIAGFLTPTSGQASVCGHEVANDPIAVKRAMGYMPEGSPSYDDMTVRAFLTFIAAVRGFEGADAQRHIDRAVERVVLDEMIDRPIDVLSKGYKRRVGLAQAILHDPPVLILDEPTAGVDIEIRRSMWEMMREVNQNGTTIILTTHYLEEAENLCRNIAIINQGQIIEYSSMKSLLGKLSVETFIFDVKENNHLPAIAGFESRWVNAQTLEVCVNKGQAFNELFDLFKEMAIEVISLKNKSNRLEELFLRLVEKNNV